jgi:hypothetical protein
MQEEESHLMYKKEQRKSVLVGKSITDGERNWGRKIQIEKLDLCRRTEKRTFASGKIGVKQAQKSDKMRKLEEKEKGRR